MERVRTTDTAERVARALALVPPRILERVECDVFEGDAAFAGFTYGGTFVSHDGATIDWRDSAFYTNPHNQIGPKSSRAPTIVLPERYAGGDRWRYPNVKVVLHEFGHALMYALDGWARGKPRQKCIIAWNRQLRELQRISGPCCFPGMSDSFSDYARSSYVEQFAEAFAFFCLPHARWRSSWIELATGFYSPDSPEWDVFNEKPANRRLLAFFNELAGWPSDLPPRALRY